MFIEVTKLAAQVKMFSSSRDTGIGPGLPLSNDPGLGYCKQQHRVSWLEHLLQGRDVSVKITKARPVFQSCTMLPKFAQPTITLMPTVPAPPHPPA